MGCKYQGLAGSLNPGLPLLKTLTPAVLVLLLIAVVVYLVYPPLSESLTVEVRPSKLTLFNNTAHTLWYAAFEQNSASTIQWSPCHHPDLCPDDGIHPGRSTDIPYLDIYQWHPGARVSVFCWRLIPDSTAEDGYRVDRLAHVVLTTPNKPLLGM